MPNNWTVREVYYPKNSTTKHFYEAFRRPGGGHGFLLSFYFHAPTDCTVFLDAVDTLKGPSLGTNFTLTSPYTILAHYGEQKWAEGFGVDIWLMRVSVGIEARALLLRKFGEALKAVDREAERRQLDSDFVASETVGIDGVL
jgi:cystathionine gamma-synthase